MDLIFEEKGEVRDLPEKDYRSALRRAYDNFKIYKALGLNKTLISRLLFCPSCNDLKVLQNTLTIYRQAQEMELDGL